MPFAPYEVLVGRSKHEEDTPAERRETDASISRSYASVGEQTFDDTLTLGSATVQDLGSLVSLASSLTQRFSEEDDCDGQTILSSHPSGAYIPPPEASQDLFAISPHPGLVAESLISMSTGCTDSISYRKIKEISENYDKATQSSTIMKDNDADGSQNATEHLLSIVEPPRKLFPIPPAPLKSTSADVVDCEYRAEDYLPENFICKLCNDVIVGALSLSCGCASSTVCSNCWETRNPSPEESKQLVDKLGYVMVRQGQQSFPSCPSCHQKIESKVNCHALDVAIFQIVLNLPAHDCKAKSLKNAYFSRLEAWRNIVIERNESIKRDEAIRRDELLARLLQEEEELFNGVQQANSKTLAKDQHSGLLFWGQAALALVVATIASLGLKAVSRR